MDNRRCYHEPPKNRWGMTIEYSAQPSHGPRTSGTNFAALILVNLLWATQYPAYKIAGERMEPAALNFWMLVLAVLLLIPLRIREKRTTYRATTSTRWKTLYEYLLLGILGIIPPSVM